jgi:hypothetical protein
VISKEAIDAFLEKLNAGVTRPVASRAARHAAAMEQLRQHGI